MNSLEALTRLLARKSPKSRARRRAQERTEPTSIPHSETCTPVASTSQATLGDIQITNVSVDPPMDRQIIKHIRNKAVTLVLNSFPIRASLALLVGLRRLLVRLLQVPPASSGNLDEGPPPSYEAATARQPAHQTKSTWRLFSSSSASVNSEKTKPNAPATHEKRVAVLSKRKTLVLDLDETLIHSTNNITGLIPPSGKRNNSLSVRVVEVVLDSKSVVYHVYKRPWVDFFLKKVAAWYTVVVFTASIQEYADPVIDWLDQGKGLISARLFRESCDLHRGAYRKNLSLISKDLSKLCLVDNSPAAYALNQANGIPIEGWVGDASDEGLLDLLPLLDSLRFTSDVRRILGIRGFASQHSHPEEHHQITPKPPPPHTTSDTHSRTSSISSTASSSTFGL